LSGGDSNLSEIIVAGCPQLLNFSDFEESEECDALSYFSFSFSTHHRIDGILTVENWLFGLRLVFCVVDENDFVVRNAL
jgi:hypothetical protein